MFFSSLLKLSAGYLNERKNNLVEVFQRRNVMVHNNGIINSIYLNKLAPELRKAKEIGSPIMISPKYLSSSIDLIEVSFILVGAELWKNLKPGDERRADKLIDISFSHLMESRWTVAEGLSYFLMNDKQLSERSQIIGRLNYWQSKKWQNEFESVKGEILAADFTAKDELYQLARHALLDDAVAFVELLPRILHSKKVEPEALETWPIFRSMRQSPEYTTFIESRGSEFGLPVQPTSAEKGQPD